MAGRKIPSRFVAVPRRAMDDPELDAYDLMVLIAIEHLGYDGVCKESASVIAKTAKCSPSQVKAKIANLVKRGYVRSGRRTSKGGAVIPSAREVIWNRPLSEPIEVDDESGPVDTPVHNTDSLYETDSSSDSSSSSQKKTQATKEPKAKKQKEPKVSKETWLSEPSRAWREICSGEFDFGTGAAYLRPVVNGILKEKGFFGANPMPLPADEAKAEAEMGWRFRRYLENRRAEGAIGFAGVKHFAGIHGRYATVPKGMTPFANAEAVPADHPMKNMKVLWGCGKCHKNHRTLYGDPKLCTGKDSRDE